MNGPITSHLDPRIPHVGYTGTRFGMTDEQCRAVTVCAERHTTDDYFVVGHHGDCEGGDEEFHEILSMLPNSWIVGHLPVIQTDRAFCTFDEERAPLPYMRRNVEIVRAAHVMIAGPRDPSPPTSGPIGGTWRTIELTRKAKKPLYLCLPDGSIIEERMDQLPLALRVGAR